MTLEEAIKNLSDLRCEQNIFIEEEEPYYEALTIAINALQDKVYVRALATTHDALEEEE